MTSELLIIFVAGYIGYKLFRIGEQKSDKPEDVIFQSAAFGLLARIFSDFFAEIIEEHISIWNLSPNFHGDNPIFLTIFSSCTIAIFWRLAGSPLFSSTMRFLNVYNDDRAASAIRSILNTKAKWSVIQLHMRDKSLIESKFDLVPAYAPLRGATINDDGIAIYITRIYRHDSSEIEFKPLGVDNYLTISYIPFSQIERIEISWI